MDYTTDPDIYDVPSETSVPGGYGGGLPVGGDSGGAGLLDFLRTLSPTAINTLLGAVGPAAGLVGTLASGGQGPTQSGTSSGTTSGSSAQSGYGNQTGFSNQTGQSAQQGSTTSSGTTQGSSSQTGTQTGRTTSNQTTGTTGTSRTDSTSTPTLDPRASSAADRLTSMLAGPYGTSAGDAYSSALAGLMGMATGGGGVTRSQPSGGPAPGPPNTTPVAAPVTGFPDKMPTDINPELVGLIKQAFGTMTGDIASQAITGARNRGFAGGADLLNTAASPIASGALAGVPAKEAEAYLAHVLQAYDLQSQNAGRKASAEQGSLNAATNALMPGVQAYGTQGSMYNAGRAADASMYGSELAADSNRRNSDISLMTALMGPQRDVMNTNLGLMNALPHGTTGTSLTGTSGTSTLSGTGTSDTFSNQIGNTLSNTIGSGTSNQTGTSGSQGVSGSASQSGSQGTTSGATSGSQSGTTTSPLGPAIATGVGNLAGGIGVGLGTPQSLMSTLSPTARASLMRLLGG